MYIFKLLLLACVRESLVLRLGFTLILLPRRDIHIDSVPEFMPFFVYHLWVPDASQRKPPPLPKPGE